MPLARSMRSEDPSQRPLGAGPAGSAIGRYPQDLARLGRWLPSHSRAPDLRRRRRHACGSATSATGPLVPPDQTITSSLRSMRRDLSSAQRRPSRRCTSLPTSGATTFRPSPASTQPRPAGCRPDSDRCVSNCRQTALLVPGQAPLDDRSAMAHFLEPITSRTSRDALRALAQVVDDNIQEQTQGQWNPEGGRTARASSASSGSDRLDAEPGACNAFEVRGSDPTLHVAASRTSCTAQSQLW